jgi:hypothetical protein
LDNFVTAAKKLLPKFEGVRTGSGSTAGTTPSAEGMAALEAQGYTLDPDGSGYLIKDGNYYALGRDNNPVLVGAVSVGAPGATDSFDRDTDTGTDTDTGGGGTDTTDTGGGGTDTTDTGGGSTDDFDRDTDTGTDEVEENARGGSIRYAAGGPASAFDLSFSPQTNIGGLPVGGMPQYDQSNTYVGYNNTDGSFIPR